MAAVDQSFGVVRRGLTPAAPKPINLRSQKFENHSLIPDVEIVPRGTCCWGSAGKAASAPATCSEKTEVSCPEDNRSNSQNDAGLIVEEQVSTHKSDNLNPVESCTLPALPTEDVTIAATCNSCPSSVVDNTENAKIDSSVESDASSFPESLLRPSSSESYSSSSVTPIARVDEQKHSDGFTEIPSDNCKKSCDFQANKGSPPGNESVQGSHDFGYFEGFYSSHPAFTRSGAQNTYAAGMAGSHFEHPYHYSFLGVPYYDAAKDKEIVVITMVGNPGVYGNYLPFPGFSDQCGRPGKNENVSLQFGHFENCSGPHVSPEMYSGEESGYMQYDQDNFNHCWNNGTSMITAPKGHVKYSPHSFCEMNPASNDYTVSKRTGRHRAANRSQRSALKQTFPSTFEPERRVTLLTKESQHEVIISNMQRRNNHEGIWQNNIASSSLSSVEDCTEVVPSAQLTQGYTESSGSVSQHGEAVMSVEASNGDSPSMDLVTFNSTNAEAGLESGESLEDRADFQKQTVSGFSPVSLHHETSLFEAVNEGGQSTSDLCCHKDGQLQVAGPPLTQSSPGTDVLDQSLSETSVTCLAPASVVIDTDLVNIAGIKSEIRCVTKVGEIEMDCVWDEAAKSTALDLLGEQANEKIFLSTSLSACSPKKNISESVKKLAAQKSAWKWQPKVSPGTFQAGLEGPEQHDLESKSEINKHCDNIHNPEATLNVVCTISGPSSLSKACAKAIGNASVLHVEQDSPVFKEKKGSTVKSLNETEFEMLYMTKESGEGDVSASKASECPSETHPARCCDYLEKASGDTQDQSSPKKVVPCTAGKIWRPKVSGALRQEGPPLTVSCARAVKLDSNPAVARFEVKEKVFVKDCSTLLEVSGKDETDDALSKTTAAAHSEGGLQENQIDVLSSMEPSPDHEKENCWQQSIQTETNEDMRGDGETNRLPIEQKECADDPPSPHVTKTCINSSNENEFNCKKNLFSSCLNVGNPGYQQWRATGRVFQPKGSLMSKAEEFEYCNSVLKGVENVTYVHGASQQVWKRKQQGISDTGTSNISDLTSQNIVLEQDNHNSLPMKNCLTDDKNKVVRFGQCISSSVASMEKNSASKNVFTFAIGNGRAHPPSRTEEKHSYKKSDKMSWVVKTESARLVNV